MNLRELLADGRTHVCDGAMGTMLYGRGVFLNVCFDEKYFPAEDVESLKQLGWRVHNVINGYGRYLRKRKTSQESTLREIPEPYGMSEDADPITDLPS